MGRPLKIAKAQAVITITNTTASTKLVTTSANFTNLGIIAGMPFVTATNIGGLISGTMYWILKVINDGNNSTFTVSETPLNANPTSTPKTLTTASGGTVSTTVAPVDMYFNNPLGPEWPATNANTYSVVGGDTAIFGKQVLANVCIGQTGVGTIAVATDSANIDGVGTDLANTLTNGTIVYTTDGAILGTIADIANANATFATFAANATANYAGAFDFGKPEAGYIMRQKGKQKYLVKGTSSGLVGQCYTANVANTALAPGQMTITATYANSATVKVQSLSDHTAELFTATSGPVATGNIVLEEANPAFVTFNNAAVANASNAMPYPLVRISNA